MSQFIQNSCGFLGNPGFEIERLFAYEIDDTQLADTGLLPHINNFLSLKGKFEIEIFNEARNFFVIGNIKSVVIRDDPEIELRPQAESVRIEIGDLKIKHKNHLLFRKINDDYHTFYESFEKTYKHNLEFLTEIMHHFFMSSFTTLRSSEHECMKNSIAKLKADLRLICRT